MSNARPLGGPAIVAATPPRITIELTNICNLRCSYCVRDEDDLYHTPAKFLSVELLTKIMRGAKEAYGIGYVSFTGGEVTIHPKFGEVIEAVAAEGLQMSFVTNGWHFDRVFPLLLKHREAVRVVAFSLDGATREAHDRWRGDGSFVRVVRAMTRCYASGLKFVLKVGVRRDTAAHLQEIALFAARLGASELHFAHLLPTSSAVEDESALTFEERREAEHEIAILSNVLKMPVGVVTGYHNVEPEPPCSALAGKTTNVDFNGRLSLCCNLSGYRGAAAEPDVVADLTKEDFAPAFERLQKIASEQNERRRKALASFAESGREVDLYTSSPCLLCLQSFGKIPWRGEYTGDVVRTRELPVLQTAASAAE
ncbi:MAG TPA: radical SAM protein [Pyrinomonadaceae bacterium]|nr:radical SAM protein [Pyrinomonadaceae bacterium]